MRKSTKIVSALLIATLFLGACSQQEEFSEPTSQEQSLTGNANVLFRLQSNQAATTRSAEDSHSYVQGTQAEYQVNSARVYLFDTPTKLFVKTISLTGITRKGSDATGNIIYEADKIEVPQGTYDIFVTANSDRIISKATEDEFLADIDSTTYIRGSIEDITGGIVMTNRASANTATVIAKSSDETGTVVNITLERTVARLDVAKAANEYKLTDDNGTQYATIKLDAFYVVNLAKYYYSYRHTAVLTSMDVPAWNLASNFGNIADVNSYVTDPYFFKKTIDASNFTNADKYYEHFYGDVSNPDAAQWTAFNAANATPDYKTIYCLENCMLAPAQKNGYSTGVIFRATVEPFNNLYRLNASGALELVSSSAPSPESMFYYDYKFFASPEALSAYITSTGSASTVQAKKFDKTDAGYRCYYKYWIRHLDNYRPTEMGVMEFGVVRNNLYRMLVTNITNLGEGGTGVINTNTDTPDEGEASLQIELNVKPWIVRDLTNIVL